MLHPLSQELKSGNLIVWEISFFAFFLAFLFGGCSGEVLLIDRLPPNLPKGYVEFYEFYPEGGTEAPPKPTVYQLAKASEVQEGRTTHNGMYSFIKGFVIYSNLRIAAAPGSHTFVVEKGSGDLRTEVPVVERMVTPVRIVITDVTVDRDYMYNKYGEEIGTTTTYRFKMHSEVGQPSPLKNN